jgi:high-affinity iron transporter
MLLGNFLIGMREGLEAALVVSILIAYLVKTGNRRALVPVWTGIAIAVALAAGFGVALSAASSEMQFKTQELFGGALSIVAVVLGYLLYRGGLKINLGRFFTWTGGALIVVAAGVFGYGFHDLQEADVLPGLNAVAIEPHLFFDKLGTPGDWLQTVLQGVLNVTPQITWLQLIMWAVYLVPVMALFLRKTGPSRPAPAAKKTVEPAPSS